jgi:UDP-GlcNAc:undecaprenyl-phosphate GlcNAc-1-phosphate transferase
MLTYLVAFLMAGVTALLLTPVVRWGALHFGLVDKPSEARKVHEVPIPRLGGIAIVIAFFVPVFGLFMINNSVSEAYVSDALHVSGLVGGATLTVALGLADDLLNLSARLKLLAQVVIAVGVYFMGYEISQIATPFGFMVQLGWLSLPVTVLWIVGVMNAINLIDGLDGLASGVSLFTVLTLFVLALISGNLVVGLTAASLAGALIGFLRYNFNPASIFMGDSGSLFLGFVLAVTAISGSAKSSTIVALMIPLLALGLPLFDTSMAIARRFLSGRPIFSADRGHVHHRLLDLGLSHRQVVLALYGVCLVFTLLALSLVYANSVVSAIVLGVFMLAVMVFAKMAGLLDMGELNAGLRYGLFRQQRAKVHLVAIEACVSAINRATSQPELLAALETLGEDVRLDAIRLNIAIAGLGSLSPVDFDWQREQTDVTVAGTQPMQQLEHQLDWSLRDVDLVGRIAFAWHCDEGVLQIPEAPGYHLVGLAVRDRLLQLAVQASTVTLGPRLVSR